MRQMLSSVTLLEGWGCFIGASWDKLIISTNKRSDKSVEFPSAPTPFSYILVSSENVAVLNQCGVSSGYRTTCPIGYRT